jgi:two-component system sensor histidine kinase KdpD
MANEEKGKGVVLAYVDGYPRVIALLRTARRYAQRHNLPWVVIHSENRQHPITDKEIRVGVLQAFTLAEEMGATVETIDAPSAAEGIRRFAEKKNADGEPVHMVFVGEVEKHGFRLFQKPPLAKELKRILPCAVEIIPLEGELSRNRPLFKLDNLREVRVMELFYAVTAVLAAILFVEVFNYFIPEAFGVLLLNRRAAFLIATAFIAGRYGLVPGLVTSVVSYVTMHFLYVDASLTGLFQRPTDFMDFGLFVIGASILGTLVNSNRATNEQRDEQIQRMQALFRMYHVSLRSHTYEKTLEALHRELSAALKTEVIFFLPAPFNPERVEAALPADPNLTDEDKAARDLCWAEAKVTGFATNYFQASPYRFKPLVTPSAAIGVLAIHMDKKTVADEAYRRLLTAISDSVALVLERVTMGQAMEDIRLREEREKLRAMLLSSVSHDLKTPLASVIGSLSVYRSIAAQLPEEQRIMLIQTALEEAQRLDSFITNILDMTRLESGQITFKQDWIKPSELAKSVLKRLRERLHYHHVNFTEGPDNEICIDTMMTGQVLQNILDNAAKYTPHGTGIEFGWEIKNGVFQFRVRDGGRGIPNDQLEKIFDKYARIKRQDSQVAGTGLGLAIARAIMQAQGGGIVASNHPDGGAIFTIEIPKWRSVEEKPGVKEKQVA